MRRVVLLALGVASSLAVAGCVDSGGGNPKGPEAGGTAGAVTASGGAGRRSTAAAFPGEPPAGVRGAPLWSAQLTGRGASAAPVGASVALITPHGDGGDGSGVEFRDAATGASHASVEVPGKPVASTWHGRPALVSESTKKTPSDGISPAKTAWVVDVFDERGQRIAHKEYPGQDKPFIVDGRRIVTEHGRGSDAGALVISDAGSDAPGRRIPCQDRVCMDESATVASGVIVHRRRDSKSVDLHRAETLAGFDPATGATLWTPQNLARPAGAAATVDPELVEQGGLPDLDESPLPGSDTGKDDPDSAAPAYTGGRALRRPGGGPEMVGPGAQSGDDTWAHIHADTTWSRPVTTWQGRQDFAGTPLPTPPEPGDPPRDREERPAPTPPSSPSAPRPSTPSPRPYAPR